jgi:DNA-binding response OmpR family regulator
VNQEKERRIMNKILIMDEDEAIRMLYADVLTEEGYEVITCGDASGLMELIGRRNPDLVLMEVLLRNCDGLDLLQDISHAFRELPIILCTACPAFREDLRSLAAHGFVIKGSNLNELKAVIEEVLEGGESPRPSSFQAHGDLHKPMAQESFSWEEAL